MASWYERTILPKFLACACSGPEMMRQRGRLVPRASGRVLELGVGMGLNLVFYDPDRVSSVSGVDPAPELRAMAEAAPRPEGLPVEILAGVAEDLPFEAASFDSVVCTFTLCSVHSPERALAEARRVLKPGGRLFYCEHGLSPDVDVARWQRRIEPLWERLAGGCRLTRPILPLIEGAGFSALDAESAYLPKVPRFAGWNVLGEAGLHHPSA
ncbi:class I SAM-dependent methyltransferase [Phenylobacterium sp.]|jgi:SAM-dependent methyltransferase|uniref:class I SAM-dependent methyltransferase n=1 Tax=Phenylobacterium sp. TaxID=1871053 RepID=UPI0025DF5741|nr:class I SAM-dependent methyltransferase [Phenylobacterium sp.]MCA3720874.1 class I SAM-dependent methyltransferase [Phenylobacterium sp.]